MKPNCERLQVETVQSEPTFTLHDKHVAVQVKKGAALQSLVGV